MHVDPSGPTYQINLEGVAKEVTDDPKEKGYVPDSQHCATELQSNFNVRNIVVSAHMVAWPLCKDDTHCISFGGNHRFHLAAVDSFHHGFMRIACIDRRP